MPFSHEKISRETETAQPFLASIQFIGAASILNYEYGNAVQKLIHANKYYNQPQTGTFIATLAQSILVNLDVDVVTLVPVHPKTRRNRGYNQVEVFAKSIAQELGVGLEGEMLKRTKRRSSQTHKNKAQRIKSLTGSFEASEISKEYKSILLVDDVMTTGSTLRICLEAIAQKSNATVCIITMARAI
ncbi:MAG: ComF family protein [Weeksellaceae bacterium]